MKTKFFSMMAMAAMLLGTSCSNDELSEPTNGQPMTANFSVQLPTGISARKVANGAKKAFADGKTATKLKYMVFDKDGNLIEGLGGEKDINLTANVQMQLTTGKEYKIVFWAANANAPYTLDDNGVVTVDYTNIKANDESLDAFYRCYDYKAGAEVENPIKLYRPFAQLNVGTNDTEAAAKTGFNKAAAKTEVKVSGIANQLNLLTGAVSGDAEVTYKLNAIPEGETFPKAGYDYLSMDYLLVGKEAKSNVDVNWQITDSANTINRTFANVPVQGNYRTNIYGALLTSTTDFNVQIEPAFETPDYVYTVESVADLEAALATPGDVNIVLANNVSGVGNTIIPVGKTVNIDLNGKTMTLNGCFLDKGDLNITNGSLESSYDLLKGNYNAVISIFADGAKFTMDGVTVYAPKALGVVNTNGNVTNATVNVLNSTIVSGCYCVSTNAAKEVDNTIAIENCTLQGETPVMYNVNGSITIKNSKLNGWRQGIMVRGGKATVENCEIVLAYNEELGKSFENFANTAAAAKFFGWGSGNNVPSAAILLGNGTSNAYQYPTTLNMKGTKVTASDPFRAVLERNGGKNVVTYTDGGNNTITGKWLKYNDATGKYDEVNK